MSNCIPDFHRISQPFREILEKPYSLCCKWRKYVQKKVALNKISWSAVLESTFTKLKQISKSAVVLAHLKKNHGIVVLTDIFDIFSAGIVTQVHIAEMKNAAER